MTLHRIVIMGTAESGKSAFMVQFSKILPEAGYDPSAEDAYVERVTIDGEPCAVEICDVDKDCLSGMRHPVIRNADGIVLACSGSPCDPGKVEAHLQEIWQTKESFERVAIVLIGKSWAERSDLAEFTKKHRGIIIVHCEVAVDGITIAIEGIVRHIRAESCKGASEKAFANHASVVKKVIVRARRFANDLFGSQTNLHNPSHDSDGEDGKAGCCNLRLRSSSTRITSSNK